MMDEERAAEFAKEEAKRKAEENEPVVTVDHERDLIVVDFETPSQEFTLVEALVFVNDVLTAALTLRHSVKEEDK